MWAGQGGRGMRRVGKEFEASKRHSLVQNSQSLKVVL